MSLQYTIRHTWKTIVLLLPFALSCGRGSDPERTLEGYLKAAVSRNTVEVRRLSCGEEVPQLLNWKIIYRVPVVVSSPGFLEEMETVRVTIDTLRSRCDSLKSYLMEDCVDIEEDEFHSFLTELKKVAGAANREQATETAPVRSMAGHLRFLARKYETPGGDEYEYMLPTGEWVDARHALLFSWDRGGFKYFNNRQIINILTIRLSEYQSMKSGLECALGRCVNPGEEPRIEKARFILDCTYEGAARGKLMKKQRAVLLRADGGRWIVTGLEEL